jgi:hypothetical protein
MCPENRAGHIMGTWGGSGIDFQPLPGVSGETPAQKSPASKPLERAPRDAQDFQARAAERDARLAADARSDVQRFLGDPIAPATPARPAPAANRRHVASHPRVDLWRK